MSVIALSADGFLIAGLLRDHHHASVFDAAFGDDVVCGAEIGLRTKLVPKLESSVGLFLLDSASEILFSGDAGDTSASRPSRRYGVEWTNDYHPLSWPSLEGDVAVTHARFQGDHPAQAAPYASLAGFGNAPGNYIPGAPDMVASAGIRLGEKTGWFAAALSLFRTAAGCRPVLIPWSQSLTDLTAPKKLTEHGWYS